MNNKEIVQVSCIICGGDNENYLNQNNFDGIIVNGEYICGDCESKIIKTRIEDSKYDEYVDKIKVVIYK